MNKILQQLPHKAKQQKKSTKKYFTKLAKQKPKQLDGIMQELHEEVFEKIDCLTCANCCKTTSPTFTNKDIDRIASHLKLRPAALIEKHLHIDEDGDYVLNSSPCTFLDKDNYCKIYDVRPKACSGYPHTNRKQFRKMLNLTVKNMSICPATYEIVMKLQKVLP